MELRATTHSGVRKGKVLVISDSRLRGWGSLSFGAGFLGSAAVLLAWGKDQGIMDKMIRCINPTDYYLLVIIHLGTNDVADNSVEWVKMDCEVLSRHLNNVGVQVVFSLIFLVREGGRSRRFWK